jgi:glutamate racemase
MKNTYPIGILDSGVGGLSVWRELVRELPRESTLYVADSKNIPYGTKTSEEIYPLAKRLVTFLISQQVKMIIVACNTITVTCLDKLRNDYPAIPIIGTVPVIKTAAAVSKNKRIGVLSTVRTADSQYQKDLIHKFAQECTIVNIGTDKLVPLVERGGISGSRVEETLRTVLSPFIEEDIDTLALGCTHYPFISNAIQSVLGTHVQLLEPSGAIARHAKYILKRNGAIEENSKAAHHFFTTGQQEQFAKVCGMLAGNVMESKIYSIEHINI